MINSPMGPRDEMIAQDDLGVLVICLVLVSMLKRIYIDPYMTIKIEL